MHFLAALSKKAGAVVGAAGIGASLFFILAHDRQTDSPFSKQFDKPNAEPQQEPQKDQKQKHDPRPKAQVRPDPKDLVRDVFHNEIQAQLHDQSLWCYHETKLERGDQQLYGACQAKDGEVDRLLAVNYSKLDSRQEEAENRRIQKLLSNPGELRHQEKKRADDGKHTRALMKIFPEAFRFEDVGTNRDLVSLNFFPDPNFHPSSREERVLSHIEGKLVVDSKEKRLLEIEGCLTSEVKFAGGLLGHLEKGGVFQVKQRDVGSGHWEMTLLKVQMRGKALFFKNINVQEDQTFTDFRQERDDCDLQQAFETVKQQFPTEEAIRELSSDEAKQK